MNPILRRYGLLWALILGLVTALTFAACPLGLPGDAMAEALEVHFIDVGQGDAIYIRTPEHHILIDAGDRGDTVPDYLEAQGVQQLDLAIGTHPHADHIGGLINVFQRIPVLEVIDPAVPHTTRTFEDYLMLIDALDIPFTEGRAGMVRQFGEVTLTLLHPEEPSSSHLNDASVVAKLRYGAVKFLFTGDAETSAEQQILERDAAVGSTILKVGHHGSQTSTTPAFLQAVAPEVAVIMCGADNRYGHPHEEVLNRLTAAGVTVYRTDLHGTIVISTNGEDYQVDIGSTSTKSDMPDVPPEQPSGAININTASLEELQEIIHIGEARALDIIEQRPFQNLDGLTRIQGISAGRLEDIKHEGKAYVP